MKFFQNLSYKTLFAILFFALAGIVFFIKIGGKTTKVSAAWWDEMWHYRKSIIVTNNTSFDAANIPYKITLDTQDLISTGKLQADADDIRIVDSNGNIIRSQVEKSTLNTAVTKIWFEATVKSNTTASYYIYYGNPSASSPNFETDIQSFSNTSTTTTIQMKDGFGYTTSSTNGGRVTDIRKNSTDLGVDGNINNSGSYPGGWWGTIPQTILNSTGPLFVEIVYGAGATGSYSAYESNIKVFDNGFAETRLFVTYNASGSENFYYYLAFATGTRNSVWINGSGTLVDQDADSGNLTEASLGQNWFGQRWTASGNYGGTIITKNNSDWVNGGTSTRASYYQTNYAYSKSFTAGSTRELRYAVFAGDGGLSEMTQKGANYGALGSTINNEEIGTAPIAYWKFDEGTGTTTFDSTSYQNNGNITGATWQNEDQCISGKCLNFDRAQNQYVLSNNTIPFTGSQTYSVWVYPKSTEGLMGILTTHSHANNSNIGINISTNKFSISIGYTDETREYQDRQSNFTIPINTWSHVELVYNNIDNSVTFYVNGKFDKQWVLAKTVKFVNDKILVGQWSNSYLGRYKFNGLIDEPKIYPYARTADQILQDYNSRGSLSGSSVNLGIKSNTAPSIKSSLVAYYKFDEGNGTTVYDTTNKYNGSLGAGLGESKPTWTSKSQCISGGCLSFDGNDYVRLPNTRDLDPKTNNYTWSGWLKFGGYTGVNREIFMASATGGSHGLGFTLNSSSDQIRFEIYGTTGDRQSKYIPVTSYLDQWHHWSFTLDSSDFSLKIYVDSKLIYTTQFSDWGSIDSYSYLYLGSYNSSLWFFNGLMDEIKIYNRALTAEEVKQDYNAGSAIQFGQTTQTIGGTTTSLDYCIPGDTSYCAPPVAEWNFEENTGTTAKDTSGNNNNFTFNIGTSAPTWTVGKKNKGSSLQFNGTSNWVQRTLSPSIPANTDYTQCFWFNSTSNTARQVMIDDANQWEHWIAINTNRTVMGCYYNTAQICTTSTATINLNTWNYTCLSVQSGQKMSLYLNGALVSENTNIGSSLPKIYDDVCVGANGGSVHGEKFTGKIDDVKIYNYARTPAQIAYDYNKGAPVGWWKLDECQGSTANDSSGNGNTGSINIGSSGTQTSLGTCAVGTSAAWTNGSNGKLNSSLNFDGADDYITINQPNIQTLPNLFTITGWINPENETTGYLITPQSNGIDQSISYSGQRLRITVAESSDTNQRTKFSASNSVPTNHWTHFAISIDDKKIKIYINGILDSEYDETIDIGGWSSNWIIGQRGNNTYYYNGKIDDVRVYNYALTDEQVRTVYNNGSINFN